MCAGEPRDDPLDTPLDRVRHCLGIAESAAHLCEALVQHGAATTVQRGADNFYFSRY